MRLGRNGVYNMPSNIKNYNMDSIKRKQLNIAIDQLYEALEECPSKITNKECDPEKLKNLIWDAIIAINTVL